jgi:hypothetical protein
VTDGRAQSIWFAFALLLDPHRIWMTQPPHLRDSFTVRGVRRRARQLLFVTLALGSSAVVSALWRS